MTSDVLDIRNNKFNELRVLDVSKYVEEKNGFSYISWAHAVDLLLQRDPTATWEYKTPQVFSDSIMVYCDVTAFGKTMSAHLAVTDYKNQAIKNPNAKQVADSMQRCLAKAIALHGIALYLYQGEDLAELDPLDIIKNAYKNDGIDGARAVYNRMDTEARKVCAPFIESIRENKDGSEK